MLSQTRAAALASIDPLGVSGGPGVELVPELTVTLHSPDWVVGVAPSLSDNGERYGNDGGDVDSSTIRVSRISNPSESGRGTQSV